jgi:hypothetical protein
VILHTLNNPLPSSGSAILAIRGDGIKALLVAWLSVCARLLGRTTSTLVDDVAAIDGILLVAFFYELALNTSIIST